MARSTGPPPIRSGGRRELTVSGRPENGPPPRPDRDGGAYALAAFEEHRGLLFSIAYRMLGSVADAEDVLQEAFLRWQRASEADIRSPRAFLVTIVSRLCINHLESRAFDASRTWANGFPNRW